MNSAELGKPDNHLTVTSGLLTAYWNLLRDTLTASTTPQHAQQVFPERTLETVIEWMEAR
jgi:hypothetical protein